MTDGSWTGVGRLLELAERKGTRVADGDTTVLLVRSGDQVFAIGSRCTHQGAPSSAAE